MSSAWPADPRAYLQAYLDAWNEPDVERVCDAFHQPAPIYAGSRVVATDPSSRRSFLTGYVDSTRAELDRGTRWEAPSMDITELGRNGALATVRWVFRRSDGSVIEDYLDSYLLARIDGRWGILADLIHDAV
jgi:hypothetical protein